MGTQKNHLNETVLRAPKTFDEINRLENSRSFTLQKMFTLTDVNGLLFMSDSNVKSISDELVF